MKIILNKDVKNVGEKWEVKDVADGFARNFLLAKGLAEVATKENMRKAEVARKEMTRKNETSLEVTQKLAQEIDGREIILKSKAEENKLFGSVTTREISQELTSQGVKVDEKNIELKNPIKETGEYSIKIKLDHGIEAEIKVVVEGEE